MHLAATTQPKSAIGRQTFALDLGWQFALEAASGPPAPPNCSFTIPFAGKTTAGLLRPPTQSSRWDPTTGLAGCAEACCNCGADCDNDCEVTVTVFRHCFAVTGTHCVPTERFAAARFSGAQFPLTNSLAAPRANVPSSSPHPPRLFLRRLTSTATRLHAARRQKNRNAGSGRW